MVGEITADEAEFAGGKNDINTLYYLNVGTDYWTMSPYNWYSNARACVFYVDSRNGYLNWASVNSTYGLRPVINLKADVAINSGSDGTASNPYIVQ